MSTRILIVDDDPIVRMGFRLLLSEVPDLEVVGEVSDGSDAVRMLDAEETDVVLMDVHMRRTSGIAATIVLRRRYPLLRIVLMTSFADSDFEQHALNAGADAFVPKTAPPEQILSVLRGDAHSIDRVADAPSKPVDDLLAALSVQEAAVARLAVDGWSNHEIAERLHLSNNTVKTYVSRCFAKLGVDNRVRMANLLRNGRTSGP